jgi:hypothetical protein
VHFTDLVRDARVEQDPFRSCGLAGIDVRHDADVRVRMSGVSLGISRLPAIVRESLVGFAMRCDVFSAS